MKANNGEILILVVLGLTNEVEKKQNKTKTQNPNEKKIKEVNRRRKNNQVEVIIELNNFKK